MTLWERALPAMNYAVRSIAGKARYHRIEIDSQQSD